VNEIIAAILFSGSIWYDPKNCFFRAKCTWERYIRIYAESSTKLSGWNKGMMWLQNSIRNHCCLSFGEEMQSMTY